MNKNGMENGVEKLAERVDDYIEGLPHCIFDIIIMPYIVAGKSKGERGRTPHVCKRKI